MTKHIINNSINIMTQLFIISTIKIIDNYIKDYRYVIRKAKFRNLQSGQTQKNSTYLNKQ